MNKNNKKTMNERTHNAMGLYKNNKNTNSNNNNPDDQLLEEFGAEFNFKETQPKQQAKKNK